MVIWDIVDLKSEYSNSYKATFCEYFMRNLVKDYLIARNGTDDERRMLKDVLEVRKLSGGANKPLFDQETYDCISGSLKRDLSRYRGDYESYLVRLFSDSRVE